ncbi:DUF1801 domain-containing protein [Leeuwenhoekiella marinoflava]|uniref:Uncharacterized protein n=2 Tax=Leeuwenhoekiella marinoflava TaxID=988 RepID=A0A4Q0PRM4_9FLAO|nr:DUF1801 domain-containing protein [Leeuwenhoekiella marinoflava]RXG32902.1 hypothetical protein DSL99_682 [Leeuwenhoekiella marinoflava]SHE61026.1 hypothetical protein SAMN02745246_00740 [Leeuwenhoekiella marinoflava DSM 3653]
MRQRSSSDFFSIGFSPRKQNLSVYSMPEFKKFANLLTQLGKHKTGAPCLDLNKLEDIHLNILEKFSTGSVNYIREKYENKV